MTKEELKAQIKKETEALRKYEREMLLKLKKNESKSKPV
jgi:hypothetical protein